MPSNKFWHMASIEPKRQFRWVATIGTGTGKVNSYVVKKVGRPEWTTAEKEHKMLGHTFYYPGPVTWNTVDVTIVDIADRSPTTSTAVGVGDDAIKYLNKLVVGCGYVPPDKTTAAATNTLGITKAKSVKTLGGLLIKQLNASGKALEEYKFYNPFVQKITYGPEFDYESDAILDVTLTIRYDWAEIDTISGV